MKGSLAEFDDLQTNSSSSSPHLQIYIVVSFCSLVKKPELTASHAVFSLLALVCLIHSQVFIILPVSTLQLIEE